MFRYIIKINTGNYLYESDIHEKEDFEEATDRLDQLLDSCESKSIASVEIPMKEGKTLILPASVFLRSEFLIIPV